jgi:hypothetical protein
MAQFGGSTDFSALFRSRKTQIKTAQTEVCATKTKLTPIRKSDSTER